MEKLPKTKEEKEQSAMEYLTTYSWAIIMTMIVIAALFEFGVFSGKLGAARAPPGECSIYRPNGAGTISEINLVGVCGGELPEFVSRFGYAGPFSQFGNSNVTVPRIKYMPLITNTNGNKLTMTGWIYKAIPEPVETAFAYGNFSSGQPPWNAIYINSNDSYATHCPHGLVLEYNTTDLCIYNNPIPEFTWIFVAIEDNGTNAIGYSITNGNVVSANAPIQPLYISKHSSVLVSTPWNGLISNIQLYNTSLSKKEIIALYNGGLGAAPINVQNLVGWWPLNGNLNDYSGNGNQGYAYNSAGISGSYYNNYSSP